jgi:hypothetical protein
MSQLRGVDVDMGSVFVCCNYDSTCRTGSFRGTIQNFVETLEGEATATRVTRPHTQLTNTSIRTSAWFIQPCMCGIACDHILPRTRIGPVTANRNRQLCIPGSIRSALHTPAFTLLPARPAYSSNLQPKMKKPLRRNLLGEGHGRYVACSVATRRFRPCFQPYSSLHPSTTSTTIDASAALLIKVSCTLHD